MINVTDSVKMQIKQIDLKDVVGQYVDLEPDGNLYRGLCPFHKEKSGSFVIHPPNAECEYPHFYCYGCHAGNREETNIGNDVIAFVMAIEEVDFPTACQMLCDRYGIPYERRQYDAESVRLKQITTQTNLAYHQNLMRNSLARGYLRERGLNDKTIADFRIGLVPPNDPTAWKRNRLVFGITDINYAPDKANTIGMGYRILTGQILTPDGIEYFPNCDEKSKYRNDAESKIFKKKQTLYGLNFAIKAIRKMGFATVVEGYMDVALMHQTGFQNTVAPMGTSFTEDQMDILKRYTNQLLLFMDSDEKGIEAMKKILPKLLKRGFCVLVVEVKNNMDPADLVLSFNHNYNKIAKYMKDNSRPALQWCTTAILNQYETIVHKAKLEALSGVLPILDKVKHRESKIAYTSAIADKLGVDANLLINNEPVEVSEVVKQPVNTNSNANNLPVWASN